MRRPCLASRAIVEECRIRTARRPEASRKLQRTNRAIRTSALNPSQSSACGNIFLLRFSIASGFVFQCAGLVPPSDCQLQLTHGCNLRPRRQRSLTPDAPAPAGAADVEVAGRIRSRERMADSLGAGQVRERRRLGITKSASGQRVPEMGAGAGIAEAHGRRASGDGRGRTERPGHPPVVPGDLDELDEGLHEIVRLDLGARDIVPLVKRELVDDLVDPTFDSSAGAWQPAAR